MKIALVVLSVYLAVASAQFQKKCYPFKLSWVLDVSGTITKSNFENTQKFVKAVVNEIGIQGNEIGVASYGNQAHIDIPCGVYTDIPGFNSGIDRIRRRPNELTNTRDGIEKGEKIINQCLGSKDIPQVMILVTDGVANRGEGGENGLIEEAKAIQARGTTLLVIAVGRFSLHQLEKMVPSEHIYTQESGFDALVEAKFISDVRSIVCQIIQPSTTTRKPTTTRRTTRKPTTTTTTTTTRKPTTTTTRRPTTKRQTLPPVGGPPVCMCSQHSLERYTCLKYDRRDIMDNFEGDCFVDKMRKAVFKIRGLILELDLEIGKAYDCQLALRVQLQGYNGDASLVFGAYDRCVIWGQSTLLRLHRMLMMKADELDMKIKKEESGEGMIEFSW